MAATDGQIAVAAARWCEESNYLREFVTKNRLPAVVKITKGQYGGLGVPTLPSPTLQSSALLVSAGRRHQIVAQAVKIKEGRRLVCVGPRLVIPATYDGYFELLSEEGRPVRCIESVADLARRRPEEGCLVRETIRAIQARAAPDGSLSVEGGRSLPVGEILRWSGETTLNQTKGGATGRFLKCLDSKGATVLLGLEQRGKFSIVAREDNISGVHTAKNLLQKRMPITVRLVHGPAPRGLKSPSHFVPELRLLGVFEEESVYALPLQKDTQFVTHLPLAAPLKILKTRNEEQLKNMPEFGRLVDKANRLMTEVIDRIQVVDGKHKRLSEKNGLTVCALRRSVSTDSAVATVRQTKVPIANGGGGTVPTTPVISKDYDEIDQIYDYVRGFAPLPKSSVGARTTSPDGRPEPPPIETIPGKRVTAQAEKRIHGSRGAPPGLPKLYVKNGQSQRSRLLRQKSASPMKEAPPSPLSKSGSPLFNIRYKSLNNLQHMDLDGGLDGGGTLDSSNSGGDVKQPEKRCRKLSRPRSLTNLVWGVGGGTGPPTPPPLTNGIIPHDHCKKIFEHPHPAVIYSKKHVKYAAAHPIPINGAVHRRGTLYL